MTIESECKDILRIAALKAARRLRQPECDVRTIAKQLHQTASLVLAELDASNPPSQLQHFRQVNRVLGKTSV